jgi:hypothetical protein
MLFWIYRLGTNLIGGLSQLLNVLFLGDPDESFSSRTGKGSLAGNWVCKYIQGPIINTLFILGGWGHIDRALELEHGHGDKELWDWTNPYGGWQLFAYWGAVFLGIYLLIR